MINYWLYVLVTVLGIEAEFVVALTFTRLEGSFKLSYNLMESVSRKSLELILLVDCIDWNTAVHLKTMQEKQNFR